MSSSDPRPRSEGEARPRARTTERREQAAVAAVIGLVVLVLLAPRARRALEPRAGTVECRAMRDRYVEHLAYQLDPDATPTQRSKVAGQLARKWQALGECEARVTRREAECALRANNADEMERCIE